MQSAATLLVMAGCGGRVDSTCEWAPLTGSYDATFTVVESNCPGEHVGDVSAGRVDFLPGACPVDACEIICDQGPTETTWTPTRPASARVTFAGATCKAVYDATLRTM